ncbi:STAS domain-containing protein [Dactylosporangium sp. NPDC000244]|uniref:STAS domain-containing protein n=1 Tax=Dactylosporangium sp. NPDC000244 TaxID=3154365 RepID=UPI00333492BF
MTISDERDTATLEITVTGSTGESVLVTVEGELDYDTAGDLRAALLDALGRDPAAVTLDLAGLRFLDSSGLGVIVSGWQRARAAGVHYVVRRTPVVIAEQFEMTGLSQVLTFGDEHEAESDGSTAA